MNADDNIVTGLLLCNSYAYCAGNPIIFHDVEGEWPSFSDVCRAIAVAALVVAGAALVVAAAPAAAVAVGVGVITTEAAMGVAAVSTGVAAAATTEGLVYEARKRKPVNLPSPKRVMLDMGHIMSGHGSGGKRGGPNKDKFPDWVTAPIAEKIIRTAYKYGERIKTQGERVFVRGPWDKRVIEMWVNTIKKVIESAWPKY